MKKLWLGTIAAIAVLTSGEAQAADLPVKAPPAAPVAAAIVNWSGFYIGGHAGIAWSRDLFTFNTPDTLAVANGDPGAVTEDFRFTPSSFIGGGQVGLQQQVEKWVFSIEGTWSRTDQHQTKESVLVPTPTSFRSIKIDDIATVTGRFGYAWDHAMVYAKAGYATVRVGIHSFDATGVTGDITRWQSGWTIGTGIEYMPWPNIVLGVEFDFYNLNFDTKGPVLFSDGTTFQISGSNADIFAVTARLSYLFNWGKTPAAVVAKY